jgi:hypothetical protein
VGFELFTPVSRISGINPGICSVNADGRVLIHGHDLRQVISGELVAVLLDRSTLRIALRSASDKEPALKLRWNKTKTTASVSLGPALKHMALDIQKVKGRHDVVRKENMLIVQVSTLVAKK